MCLRNVLGVLEDDERRLWDTFAEAIALADAERARLTLVMTQQSRRLSMWCGAWGAGALYIPAEAESPVVMAGRLLARAAEVVPMQIPVTTIVLGINTDRELRRLVETGAYDTVVAGASLLRRSGRLRRECCRDGVAIRRVPDRDGAAIAGGRVRDADAAAPLPPPNPAHAPACTAPGCPPTLSSPPPPAAPSARR